MHITEILKIASLKMFVVYTAFQMNINWMEVIARYLS